MGIAQEAFEEKFDYDTITGDHVAGLELAIAWAENENRINTFRGQLQILLKIAKGRAAELVSLPDSELIEHKNET